MTGTRSEQTHFSGVHFHPECLHNERPLYTITVVEVFPTKQIYNGIASKVEESDLQKHYNNASRFLTRVWGLDLHDYCSLFCETKISVLFRKYFLVGHEMNARQRTEEGWHVQLWRGVIAREKR